MCARFVNRNFCWTKEILSTKFSSETFLKPIGTFLAPCDTFLVPYDTFLTSTIKTKRFSDLRTSWFYLCWKFIPVLKSASVLTVPNSLDSLQLSQLCASVLAVLTVLTVYNCHDSLQLSWESANVLTVYYFLNTIQWIGHGLCHFNPCLQTRFLRSVSSVSSIFIWLAKN